MPQLASRTTILYCCHFQIHWMYALTTNVWVGRGRVWIRMVCPQLLNNQPLMFMVAKTRSSLFRSQDAWSSRGYVSDPPKFESILHPHAPRTCVWERFVCTKPPRPRRDVRAWTTSSPAWLNMDHTCVQIYRWINCSPNSRTWESDTRQVKWTSDVWPAHPPGSRHVPSIRLLWCTHTLQKKNYYFY